MRSEDVVHKAIVANIRYRGNREVLVIHIANNPRGPRDGARLKAMGMLKGAPDMVYAMHDGRVLWHEIKTEEGKLSPHQKYVHSILKGLGHEVIVTYGLDDALWHLSERGIIK